MIVNTFGIRFLGAAESGPPDGVAYGEIQIGAFRERFQSDLSFWKKADYARQWRSAISWILESDRAAMITSLGDPASANFIRWWVMYREAREIVFQEQVLFINELTAPFDPEVTWKIVRERRTVSENGQEISEWRSSVEALRAFLEVG